MKKKCNAAYRHDEESALRYQTRWGPSNQRNDHSRTRAGQSQDQKRGRQESSTFCIPKYLLFFKLRIVSYGGETDAELPGSYKPRPLLPGGVRIMWEIAKQRGTETFRSSMKMLMGS